MYSAARASHEIELILLASEDELPDDSRHLLDIDLNTVRKRLFEEQENYVTFMFMFMFMLRRLLVVLVNT